MASHHSAAQQVSATRCCLTVAAHTAHTVYVCFYCNQYVTMLSACCCFWQDLSPHLACVSVTRPAFETCASAGAALVPEGTHVSLLLLGLGALGARTAGVAFELCRSLLAGRCFPPVLKSPRRRHLLGLEVQAGCSCRRQTSPVPPQADTCCCCSEVPPPPF